jgi:hypothetical protein
VAATPNDLGIKLNIPSVIKSAVMTDRYNVLTFEDQLIKDIQMELKMLEQNYARTLDNFKKAGGVIELGAFEDGRENPGEYLIMFGSTVLALEFDQDMKLRSGIHYMDFTQKPIKPSEITEIAKVIQAAIYRDTPTKAALILELSAVDLRNGRMVNGIQDLADRIRQADMLIPGALNGANIEEISVDEVYNNAKAELERINEEERRSRGSDNE